MTSEQGYIEYHSFTQREAFITMHFGKKVIFDRIIFLSQNLLNIMKALSPKQHFILYSLPMFLEFYWIKLKALCWVSEGQFELTSGKYYSSYLNSILWVQLNFM